MEASEYNDVKTTIISIVIVMNVIANSLVIAVIARYPQLREDRTTLFMFSLSVSDLACGCTAMPINAAVCSSATTNTVSKLTYLPNFQAFFAWWFGIISMYSLCWLTVSKAIFILNPLRTEKLLPRRRCYIVIGLTWTISGLFSLVNFKFDIRWNMMLCTNRYPESRNTAIVFMSGFVIGCVIPGIAIVHSTVRIFIEVVRTHRQISALGQSLAVNTGDAGFVTLQAMRSSKNAIITCVTTVALNMPFLVFCFTRSITTNYIQREFLIFAALSIFKCNTFVNSLLYLFLYRSVRRKTAQMISTVWANIRAG